MRKSFIMILCAVLTLLSTNASSKTLVVYYSYTNYCREIVSTLTSQIEADVLEMPNVRHWNGATPWSDAECMTVTEIAPGEQHAVQLQKVTDEEFSSPITHENMIVRIAEIEVYPLYLKEYLEYANEVDRLSVEREPGVICLFPMQSAEDSTKIRILEIYASEEVYQNHLKTDHFQKYKQGTLHMVKDLKLPAMRPLDPETMKLIFKKQR